MHNNHKEYGLDGVRLIPADTPDFRRLGAHIRGNGIDFAVIARRATNVDLCILSDDDSGFERRWSLIGPNEGIWHGHLEGVGVGTRYGYRVHGPWDPDSGLYHNPSKLLLDPYGRGIEGSTVIGPEVFAHQVDAELYPTTYPLIESSLDSGPFVPHSVVTSPTFDIAPKPRTRWNKTVIYELHVKGFTLNNTGIPEELRGTYAGLAHPTTINYLRNLGITAVELLPVHAKHDETFLSERGLTNYWGYSTLSFFSPEPSYATKQAQKRGSQAVIDEFRGMVSILHQAGIEVILDVVYNHTCEGAEAGTSLSWRGFDAPLYYRYSDEKPRRIIDVTGTGNSLNADEPLAMQMVLDSLRYWSSAMGVDGFRFDLASTLGRFSTGYTMLHPLLTAIATDAELCRDKLIAEPWDVGPGGWQTGNFLTAFSEWNDRFRDTVRSFWLSDFRSLSMGRSVQGPVDLATRLAGSSDLFSSENGAPRGPRSSINYVTAHDGFTLADLTSYDHKHNSANLEENHDGSSHNNSWNHGIEGVVAVSPTLVNTDLPYTEILSTSVTGLSSFVEDIFPTRQRSQRNLLTTMLISTGTPMIVAGDEFQRTQYGNNNAYCQDSPISWVDWDLSEDQKYQHDTVRWLLALRRAHPVLRPDRFADGHLVGDDTIPDVSWFTREGTPVPNTDWSLESNRVFQMLRSGRGSSTGRTREDRDALAIFNGTLEQESVTVPRAHNQSWLVVMDTSWNSPIDGGIDMHDCHRLANYLPLSLEHISAGEELHVEPQSMIVLLSF